MQQPDIKRDLRRLFGHLSARRRWQLVFLFGLMVVRAATELLSIGALIPFIALLDDPGRVNDYPVVVDLTAAAGVTPDNLVPVVTFAFVAGIILSTIVRLAMVYFSNRFSHALGADLSSKLYARMLWQPYSWHVRQESSQLITAIKKIQSLVRLTISPLLAASIALIAGLAILGFIVALEPAVFFAVTGTVGMFYVLVSRLVRRVLRRNSRTINRSQTEKIMVVQEALGGVRDVQLDHSQPFFLSRFRQVEGRYRRAMAQNATLTPTPRFILEAIGMVSIALAAYFFAQREQGFSGALPLLAAMAFGAQRLLPMFQTLYTTWSTLNASYAIREEVLDFLDLAAPRKPENATISFEHRVRLVDVCFRYKHDGPWVIRKLSLEIVRGACVGLVGVNGGGKSTTLDLLIGLLHPVSGDILIDNTRLTGSNQHAWQNKIAHVPQFIYLSSGTIRENIAFGVAPKLIDDDRVRQCAELAHIRDFIESLDGGFDARVGERGAQISGGQRQRIGIARALYKRAELLVLDEATSALDAAAEQAIVECVNELKGRYTIVIIGHRLAALESCDKIYAIEGGQVARAGTFAEIFPDAASASHHSLRTEDSVPVD